MGFVNQIESGKWKAFWREPSGAQRSKTFRTKKEANAFLAQVELAKTSGIYVSPHAGRSLFAEHAAEWMQSWNTERTTAARDESIMRTHVLPKWGSWQLGKVDHLSVQKWITGLSQEKSRATVAECKRMLSGVMRSAVKNRIIGVDPTAGVRIPKRRKRDSDERYLSREEVRQQLLPAVRPERYRVFVAVAAFAGLRWGEAAGLCEDAVDLDAGLLRVIRTVTEVAGHVEFKPFPKSRAGRRTVPLPKWLVAELREYMRTYQRGPHGLIFTNEVGGPLRRTLFRSRVWRPALVRAGLLGEVSEVGAGKFEAVWMDEDGDVQSEVFGNFDKAVQAVARNEHGGVRFHDLRDMAGTWLADDGMPPHKIAVVLGHENATTTMQYYVRRVEDWDAVRKTMGDGDDSDDDGSDGVLVS
ncbi:MULTISPECIES: tyrosine-type recombinase/integrase [Nocardia]|uniref:tyrosine-type recombinase/integrase n=1 Tax=Nocardia abscessus TaxID=120957 RepID=UPI00189470A9|nr:site-specific integrase [Nocardia abscessus]MBF6473712.1 tyrosine-type recombinase/integrase [Nocardia abscessus]